MPTRKLWVILAAIWFLLTGLLLITNFTFQAQPLLMGILAIAVAVTLAFDK